MPLEKGYIQVYTGNGKGKTTAAIGLAVRALGSGLRILFVQFMKDYPYGEVNILKDLSPNLVLRRYGNDAFVFRMESPPKKMMEEVKNGLNEAERDMVSGKFDIVILDEILVSVYFGLFSEKEVINFLKKKPDTVEIVLTGRYSTEAIDQRADLLTEMKEIKHYYATTGVLARKGIES
ncbi:MAG TPA: cob(I)yrinic acid a,c-diamide adenosyltransferase [Caldithrix abyssi]|uniref:corrinoid adenosyltransferase n=1 Tax=Caldithrix abyssi TaxID=187145 RepID=A0A7V4UDK8_CALAY|nr:cob(I)yrinic acid a,c-diamide adenosyltransferase [Caldithrix abyssi]